MTSPHGPVAHGDLGRHLEAAGLDVDQQLASASCAPSRMPTRKPTNSFPPSGGAAGPWPPMRPRKPAEPEDDQHALGLRGRSCAPLRQSVEAGQIGQHDGRVAWTLAPAWLQLPFRGAGAGEVMPSEAAGDEEGEFRLKPS